MARSRRTIASYSEVPGSATAAWFAAQFGPRMPVITGQIVMTAGLVILCVPPATAPT
ncbi:hypothetical protein [Streptomyces sp. NPDC001530]|uniref:hypothetical protein n=1 Tax=Streptomyces sp. NPDC001530 TaxID=3364582 RepID=UPI00369C75D8